MRGSREIRLRELDTMVGSFDAIEIGLAEPGVFQAEADGLRGVDEEVAVREVRLVKKLAVTLEPGVPYNNIWGLGAAAQCIWVSGSQWGTTTNQPNTAGVKSYPNISLSPGKAISALNTYTSSFDITVPSGGAWTATYDIRLKKSLSQIEVTVWVNYTQDKDLPISSTPLPAVSNVTIGGHAWNVYYGQAGVPGVISLVRTTNTNSATVDIKAILNWLIANQGSFSSSWTLDQVQFGFEIVSDGSVQSFNCNSFSITSS
jgi:hypothetical protein